MRIKGRFKADGGSRVFETEEEIVHCSNCLKKIYSGESVYVCELRKDVYCSCWNGKDTPPCKNTIYARNGSHQDIYCKLKIIEVDKDGVRNN